MLSYSYYQDESDSELESRIRSGRQWLHKINDEATLRALYEPAADGSPPLMVLLGGQLTRPLETLRDGGGKGNWGRKGSLVLISTSAADLEAGVLAARTKTPAEDLLPFHALAPREPIIPGPPSHPQAMTVSPSIHDFVLTLRERVNERSRRTQG